MFDSSGKKQNNKSFIFLVIFVGNVSVITVFLASRQKYTYAFTCKHTVYYYTRDRKMTTYGRRPTDTTFVRSIPEEYMNRDRTRPAVHKRSFRQPSCNRRKIHVTLEISITGFVMTTWPVDPSKYTNNVPKTSFTYNIP